MSGNVKILESGKRFSCLNAREISVGGELWDLGKEVLWETPCSILIPKIHAHNDIKKIGVLER